MELYSITKIVTCLMLSQPLYEEIRSYAQMLANNRVQSMSFKSRSQWNKHAYNCGIETQIENVSTHLNAKVHELAKTLIRKYQDNPKECAAFSISSYRQIDPALLLFIEKLTVGTES